MPGTWIADDVQPMSEHVNTSHKFSRRRQARLGWKPRACKKPVVQSGQRIGETAPTAEVEWTSEDIDAKVVPSGQRIEETAPTAEEVDGTSEDTDAKPQPSSSEAAFPSSDVSTSVDETSSAAPPPQAVALQTDAAHSLEDPVSIAATQQIVLGVGVALTHMASMTVESDPPRLTCFHSIRPPGITIPDYLARLHKYFNCSIECCVMALMYIDRLSVRCPKIPVSPLTIHRLLATSLVISAKYHDDAYYSNAFYARVSGLRLQELNALERRFLQMLGWNLFIRPDDYEQYIEISRTTAAGASVQA